jgi:hypothetical protein
MARYHDGIRCPSFSETGSQYFIRESCHHYDIATVEYRGVDRPASSDPKLARMRNLVHALIRMWQTGIACRIASNGSRI